MPMALGIALHAYTVVFQSSGDGGNTFLALLFAWASFPYVFCFIALLLDHRVFAVLASVGCLAVDLAIYYSVFVAPTSSTASLGLLFAPAVNLGAVLPLAAVAALVFKRVSGRGTAA